MMMKTDKPMHNRKFKGMSLVLKFRDVFYKPRKILMCSAILKPGSIVLDYGCGPGSYSIESAQAVGEAGKIYSLDIHPLAIENVQKLASERGLTNIETILSDCKTSLPAESVDVVLLYYTFHYLKNSDLVLKELHRVMKSEGILSFMDFNIKKFSATIIDSGLFKLEKENKKIYTFSKI